MLEYAFHTAKKIGTFVTGRAAVSLGVGGAVASSALNASMGAMIALPLGTGVMAYLTQMDHEYNERDLTNFYREELAAKFRMRAKDVGVSELKNLAKGMPDKGIEANPVIAEALKQNDKSRFVSMAVHAVAAVGTLGLVTAAALTGAVPAMVLGVGAMLTCSIADMVLQNVAEKIFDLKKPTQHDHVRELQQNQAKGHGISRQQVFGVLLASRPAMAAQIESSTGIAYDKLTREEQGNVAAMYGQPFNLDALTHDLNKGIIKPQEVAFISHGQHSGVPPHEPLPPVSHRISDAAHQMWQSGLHKAHDISGKAKQAFCKSRVFACLPEAIQHRLNGTPVAPEMQGSVQETSSAGFVERLQQRREQAALATGSGRSV